MRCIHTQTGFDRWNSCFFFFNSIHTLFFVDSIPLSGILSSALILSLFCLLLLLLLLTTFVSKAEQLTIPSRFDSYTLETTFFFSFIFLFVLVAQAQISSFPHIKRWNNQFQRNIISCISGIQLILHTVNVSVCIFTICTCTQIKR